VFTPAISLLPQGSEPSTILLVEDEPILLETIGECLRDWGYHVLEAPDAQEAINKLAAASVDLIFSDIRMPGRIDGFGLARWVRERYPAIPILLTTGYEGQSSGPTDSLHNGPILRKPYNLASLRRRVECLLADQIQNRGCG